MQRAGITSLLLALSLLFGACDEASVSVYDTPQDSPVGKSLTTLPWFMDGFSLLDEHTEELAVGELVTRDGCEIGSAVLIAPRVVLTAGHCLDQGNVTHFKAGCEYYRIADYRLHPKFKVGETIFMDIAVVVLETPCPATPIPLLNPDTNVYSRGEPLTVIGFGGDYKRRSNWGEFAYYGTLIEDPTCFKMYRHETTVFFGDSGGAVIDANGILVGVVCSLAICDSRVFENSATRLDLVADWIQTTALDLSGVPIRIAP